MNNDIEPVAGNCYQRIDDGTLFQVITVDEDEELVEIQDFEGDVGEVTLEEWASWDIEAAEPPDDWTAPVDDIDEDDLDYSEIRSVAERRALAQERYPERLPDRSLPEDENEEYTAEMLVEGRVGASAAAHTAAATPGKRADGLKPKEVEAVRRKLTDRLEFLRSDIERELRKYDNEAYALLAERVADPGDQAWRDLVADINLAEVTRDVNEIREIERALNRLAHGHYGICISCGEPIDPERLEANPAAVRCFECQRELEARRRQTRPSM